MRLLPLILLILLLTPCGALASTGGKLTIHPNPINGITPTMPSVSNSSDIPMMNNTKDLSDIDFSTDDTDVQTFTPVEKAEVPSESVVEDTLVNAMCKMIVNCCNMCLSGLGGTKAGELNGTDGESVEKVAIFAVVAHTIDPTTDEATMKDVEDVKQVYTYAMFLFAMLLALFLLYQQLKPQSAAKMIETVTGTYSFVGIDDMVEYYFITCGWFLSGPLEFYCTIWLNNYLVMSLMLSVLDLVSFDSENVILYAMMTVLWIILIVFFALRLVTIIVVVRLWYLLGIMLSLRKTRWIGILVILYMAGIVFYQFFLVYPAVVIVTYVNTHAMMIVSESFVYLGLFVLECMITAIVVLWPLGLALLAPQTWKLVLTAARFC